MFFKREKDHTSDQMLCVFKFKTCYTLFELENRIVPRFEKENHDKTGEEVSSFATEKFSKFFWYIYIYTDKKNVCDARVFSRMEKLFDDSEIRFTMDPAEKMYHGRSKVGDFPYPSKLWKNGPISVSYFSNL